MAPLTDYKNKKQFHFEDSYYINDDMLILRTLPEIRTVKLWLCDDILR